MSDKIQQLLELTDNPHECSEEQIQKMLQDDDMRATYAVMVLAAQAFDAQRETEPQSIEQNVAVTIAMGNKRRLWRKVAIFIGVFLVSGLAVAAFLPMGKTKSAEEKPAVVVEKEITDEWFIEPIAWIPYKNNPVHDVTYPVAPCNEDAVPTPKKCYQEGE